MAAKLICPELAQLQRCLNGAAADEEAVEVAEHLALCPHCAETFAGLEKSDTFLSVLRQARPVVEDERVQRLQERLATWLPSSDAGLPLAEPLAPAECPDEIGRLGRYRILGVLGRGGMGVVYRAHDPNLNRAVAIKVIEAHWVRNTGFRERFLREAEITAKLRHPNVVTLHDQGEVNGRPFLVMELLEGESLHSCLRRVGKLSEEETIRIARQIAEGLEAAHAGGLIHRDITPGNIWLESGDGCKVGEHRVKLLDFGLAREQTAAPGLTQSGTVVGTAGYLSPEQARGEPADARSDLFSLGCVLYQMLTGKLPFKGQSTAEVLAATLRDDPPPLQTRSPTLDALVVRLLRKDPAQRPGSAKEVRAELDSILQEHPSWQGESPLARGSAANVVPAPWSEHTEVNPGPRPEKTSRWLQVAVGVLAAAVLVLAILHLWPPGGPGPVSPPVLPGGPRVVSWDFDPGQIAQEDRYPGQPPELVAVWKRKERLRGLPLFCVAIRPDGREIATGGEDGEVELWGLDGQVTNRLSLLKSVRALAWSPEGEILASAGQAEPQQIRLWDANKRRALPALPQESVAWINRLRFSPDGKFLAAAGSELMPRKSLVWVWRLKDQQRVQTWEGHGDYVRGLAFSPDGQWLASAGSADSRVILWPLRDGLARRELPAANVHAVAFLKDGRLLASMTGNISIWETRNFTPLPGLETGAWEGETHLGVASNEQWLAWAHEKKVVLWDLQRRVSVRDWPVPMTIRGLDFAPDNRHVVVVGDNGSICIFEVPKAGK